MKNLIAVALLAACSKSPPSDPDALPAAQLPALKEAVAKAATTIDARKQSLAKSVTSDAMIKASSQADTTKKPCPRTYTLPDEAGLRAYVLEGTPSLDVTYEVTRDAPHGANLERFDTVRAEIAESVSKGTAKKGDLERLQAAEAKVVDELILDGSVSDAMPMGTTYQAGTAYGTAYLFSYAENRIICAGKIDAKSSDSLDYQFKHDSQNRGEKMAAAQFATVKRDLEVNIAKAIATNLYATWVNDTPPP